MDLTKRKNMRLKAYDYSTNGAYFITICTDNRRHLFGEIVEAALCGRPNSPNAMLEKWLHEVANKYPNVRLINMLLCQTIYMQLYYYQATTQGRPYLRLLDGSRR